MTLARMAKIVFVLPGLFLVGGCAGARILENAPEAVATEAKAEVDRSSNANSRIQLKIKHLAKPEKFSPSAKNFVVWVSAKDSGNAQNVGAFNVDDDLKAEIETLTPHERFELFITAEPSRNASAPTGRKLVWGDLKQ